MAVHIVTVMLAAVVIVMIQVVGAVRDREVDVDHAGEEAAV